jgi:TonB-linked SusC/RagA family outer membrane protein
MKKFLLTCFALAIALYSMAQERTITGEVTSTEDGSSLPGVNVIVKGTTIGTATDADGKFSLSIPSTGGFLVFSFIGLEAKEIEIGDRTVVNVSLGLDVTQLSEVVVVGYGTQERKDLTGSVASIGARDIENLVAPSFDSQLAGRAAGVQVTTPGGIIGQRPIIRIRGVNSLTSSADPLIVIDGVPVVSDDRSSIVSSNPLANINPADIQSYEVLKDGSSTAIYGSRAANGVILITTKRGTKGKASVNYSGSVGFNEEVSRFDLLNGDQFTTIANEKRGNANLSTTAAVAGINSDWQDYIFRKGAIQQHNLSLSGGGETTNYFFSLGYTNQESAVLANDMSRYSFRANIDQTLFKRVKTGISLSYTFQEINGLNNGANSLSGVIYGASRMLPNVSILDPANVAFDGFNVMPDGSALEETAIP